MGNEFIVEGKKYISASRASKLYGYNSDYIGQLCRKNLVDCRMVGRVWFVEEISIKNHKIIASQTPRGRIPTSRKNLLDSEKTFSGVSIISPKDTVSSNVELVASSPLSFKSHFQTANDFEDVFKDIKQSNIFARRLVSALVVVLLFVIATPYVLNIASNSNFSNPVAFFANKNSTSVISEKITPALDAVKNYKTETTASVAYSANIFYALGDAVGQKVFDSLFAIKGGFASVGDFFTNTTDKLKLAFFDSKSGSELTQTRERTGVAVVPSANDADINQQVKEYVVNSFSDEAQIVPDESGNSGLIKPVFKNESDQEYLYVIVPVKEGQN